MFVNPLTHRIWPQDPDEYGVSPAEKEKFDHLLDELSSGAPYGTDEFRKRFLLLYRQADSKIQPTFHAICEKDGSSPRLDSILIDARKPLGPASSEIFKVFNLTTGKSFVKKTIKSVNEMNILNELSKNPIEGVHKVFLVSSSFLFVDLYQEDLCEYYQRGHSFLQTSAIISDLIKGLSYLHGLETQQGDELSYKCFHADLKPKNIFVSNSGVVIGDFGFANSLTGVCGTPLYMPPEKLNLRMAGAEAHSPEVIKNNWLFGQQADVWALGLIFSGVIRGFDTSVHKEMPVLMKRFYDRLPGDTLVKEVVFLSEWAKASYEEIRDDWRQLLEASTKDEETLLRQIPISRMLNPDPTHRLSSALELELFLPLLNF